MKRLAHDVRLAVGWPDAAESLGTLQGQLATAESRLGAVVAELAALEGMRIDEADVDRALSAFEPAWEGLSPIERGRLLDLLVEGVDYDRPAGKLAIRFRPTGIRSLATMEARQ